ncbi:MAG: HAD-IB family hydrolase [Acidimicrobiales bacterium]
MTGARDDSHNGEEPEQAPQRPEEAELPEPGGPDLADGADGLAGPDGTPPPTAPKRRRSRNRGRHRHGTETAAPTEGATSSAEDAPDGSPSGDSPGAEVSRGLKRPVPPSYGQLEAAFFDLDKTVIAKASMVAFGRPFYHGGLINRRTALRALYGELVYLHLGASEQKLNRIRESVLKLIRGWRRDRVCEIVAEAIEEIVEPIIFEEAADLIDWHRDQGRLVVIVSASPEEIVIPLSRFLGADECIASRAQLDDEGRYTGTMQFYAFGPFKAEAMDVLASERGIDLAASYAYTDSYTDLPMLEAVGHPVAVNPDRVLNRYAREHDFEVLHFSQTVSLWSRVRDRIGAVPPRPAIAASAGAVALGVAAAAAGWWVGSRRREA